MRSVIFPDSKRRKPHPHCLAGAACLQKDPGSSTATHTAPGPQLTSALTALPLTSAEALSTWPSHPANLGEVPPPPGLKVPASPRAGQCLHQGWETSTHLRKACDQL